MDKYFLSVLAIAKNEGPYLREWIEYHRIVGVDKFYIYDNGSTDDTCDVLAPYIESGIVDYIYWPGTQQQIPAYISWMETRRHETQWIAVIDLDEFITPIDFDNIPDFLRTQPDNVGQVCLGWENFGSNGFVEKPAGLITENYTMRSANSAQLCQSYYNIEMGKCIARADSICHIYLHGFELLDRVSVDVNGMPVIMHETVLPREKMVVNHYHTKSKSEYFKRKSGGDAFHGTWPDDIERSFNMLDRNDVKCDRISRFVHRLKNII